MILVVDNFWNKAVKRLKWESRFTTCSTCSNVACQVGWFCCRWGIFLCRYPVYNLLHKHAILDRETTKIKKKLIYKNSRKTKKTVKFRIYECSFKRRYGYRDPKHAKPQGQSRYSVINRSVLSLKKPFTGIVFNRSVLYLHNWRVPTLKALPEKLNGTS